MRKPSPKGSGGPNSRFSASSGRAGKRGVSNITLSVRREDAFARKNGRVTVDEAIDLICQALIRRSHPTTTVTCVVNAFQAFIRAGGADGSDALVDVQEKNVRRAVSLLHQRYSPESAYSFISILRRYFRIFVQQGFLFSSPFESLGPIRKPKPPAPKILSRGEVEILLSAPDIRRVAGIRDRAILEVLYSTAMRRTECARLQRADVDLSDQSKIMIRDGKGAKDRVVPLGRTAAGWVERYLKERQDEHPALWLTAMGEGMSPAFLGYMVRKTGIKAGFDRAVGPHDLRRSSATHMLRAGASVWVVKDLLGHVDRRTLVRYLRVDLEDVRRTHEETHPRK